MTTWVIVWILTALATVVVVLTRVRLRNAGGSGRFEVSDNLLRSHTVAGALAVVLWTVFLASPADSVPGSALVGIIAIGAWWITSLCGLVILSRWLPSGGRHAPSSTSDSWGEGPGLSVLAHVGLTLGVLVFTWAYLTAAV